MSQVGGLKVAIVGGGLGGLGLALSLLQVGITDVVVFEKDTNFGDRKQGYGLTLTNNPKGPLAKLGLLDECVKRDCASTCHWVFSPEGRVLGYYGRAFLFEDDDRDGVAGDRGNLRIPRQDLRQMLLDRLPPNVIEWDRRLRDYTEDEEGVVLHWDDGSSTNRKYDVVVGADGIRSVVRQIRDTRLELTAAKLPAVPGLKYLGITVILGISTAQHPLLQRQGFYVLDGENRLFTMPFRESESEAESESETGTPGSSSNPAHPHLRTQSPSTWLTMWQLSFSGLTEEQATSLRSLPAPALLAEAKRRMANWFPPCSALVAATSEREVWATGLYDRNQLYIPPRDRGRALPWATRVTVLGDAAHPMSMFKGQGCNQALEDGPLLAAWLAGLAGAGAGGRVKGRDQGARTETDKRKLPPSAVVPQPQPPLAPAPAPAPHFQSTRAAILTRLRCYEREMVSRTWPKVHASRAAAQLYHSPLGVPGGQGVGCVGMDFALGASLGSGVGGSKEDFVRLLCSELWERGVSAMDAVGPGSESGARRLEQRVLEVLRSLR